MSTIIKCDITGQSDVNMLSIDTGAVGQYRPETIDGERLCYDIAITNANGYHAEDVAESYVLEELIGIFTKRLNSLRNPSANQTEQTDPSSDIKVIGGDR